MNTFIQIYILISLWFWAGMLLSEPLRRAFGDMHRRVLKKLYGATVEKLAGIFKTVVLYAKNRRQAIRISIARSLVSNELLDELNHKNFVAAISRARQIGSWNSGIQWEEFQTMGQLALGKSIDANSKKEAVFTAFKLCDTDLFQQIINRVPRAQERILLALDQIEGRAPYDTVKNEAYRKFIRE